MVVGVVLGGAKDVVLAGKSDNLGSVSSSATDELCDCVSIA